MTVTTRITSSLEKCFPTDAITDFAPLRERTVLGGEMLSIQLLLCYKPEVRSEELRVRVRVEGDTSLRIRQVVAVPNALPAYADHCDDNYLSLCTGLYPDLLMPSPYGERHSLLPDTLHSLWLDADADAIAPGTHDIKITVEDEAGALLSTEDFRIVRLDESLPPLDIKFTQWFHYDSLADYYGVKAWSDEHFRIIEAFARAARREGVNMILTPIHTPPLDTEIGGERTTMQLVRITREGEEYRFDFTLFDRFISMMLSLGFEYFEMAHLYTQWGAKHAPKIVLTHPDGREERIFGWDTDATGEEYASFLRAYIPALSGHIEQLGIKERCHFHISDEPTLKNYESYTAAKSQVRELLRDYPIMDASSTYELYRDGVVEIPIPADNRIRPYLDAGVAGLWTYYCCEQTVGVANNLLAMPSYRTHSLAYQMFKYDIVGFLQWGFNFYYTRYAIGKVNPFLDTTAGHWVPGGDPFVVYPAPDGTPYESLRLLVFREMLDELRLLRMLASRLGKQKVLSLVEGRLGTIEFDRCATASAPILDLHEALISLL